MRKEDKSTVLEVLQGYIQQYPHFYLTDIEGLNAEKTTALRRQCNKSGVKLVLVKNTLMRAALSASDVDFAELYGSLKGNTAVMFSESANAPAKLIKEFTKDTKGEGKPYLKAAYAQEGIYVGREHLDYLIAIKSKEELIGDVIALLQSPAKNVISSLQSVGQTIHGVLKTLEER